MDIPGLPDPKGLTLVPSNEKPHVTYTVCNLCEITQMCARIGIHFVCTTCEVKMFKRLKLILKFE